MHSESLSQGPFLWEVRRKRKSSAIESRRKIAGTISKSIRATSFTLMRHLQYFRPEVLRTVKMASEDDYFSRLECKKLIISHMERGEWKSVLEYYDSKHTYREPNLVWIKPSIDLLQFFESCLIGYLGLKKVNHIIFQLIHDVNSAVIN